MEDAGPSTASPWPKKEDIMDAQLDSLPDNPPKAPETSFSDKIRHPKKRAMLAAYARTCHIGRAAAAAGIDRTTHYTWMVGDPDYRAAFERARWLAGDIMEDECIRRGVEGDDGQALLHCHAGCTAEAVVSALGLAMRDIMPANRSTTRLARTTKPKEAPRMFSTAEEVAAALGQQHGKRSGLWTYHDGDGEPLGLVVRWDKPEGKDKVPNAPSFRDRPTHEDQHHDGSATRRGRRSGAGAEGSEVIWHANDNDRTAQAA
jgi:hypothetical protein